ncbi:chemotaxis protein CheW [bacterium (Candidatus Blackallbacteria) CG17_big_fil_post_rev_8_21_14_2_50_48_46]|uniref:Chemotaxis protein CheW n=1 Tax=bacterium (Candidatus Blackallbacteria) CG17_big_fil_post_rev_8_21_14_2_50_48_46 TaxID=2014261 RepID=A0A2M7G1P3_9BACT|nr:MAG: chemotaxis protein CheW [bacterium (Candidatus Blackallbacteria) CG18_big_fil_WC_8_21_14_2_50_49_26]PIW15659.1 MAG: chemotaxis protein CheW [bacterium (Candidatus Blackallbacteria) CG17_big_fil_post_rev_8_21_14_2_50_48_46]PIW47302.1 MAG: chemotaxis protein CheW [bacterium (Candidatus Blackallbacteria) CG13_big_fil_rev_8_21_14_2_50_49_14]
MDEFDLYEDDDINIDDTYLTFSIDLEEYAICVSYVTEIVRMQKIIEMPDVPAYIKGVINLRGKIVPVMDIRKRFNLPSLEYSDRTVIIVLEIEGVLTGIAVDRVNDVTELPAQAIEPPPHFARESETHSLIKGMGKSGEHVYILLDIEPMLQNGKIQSKSADLISY